MGKSKDELLAMAKGPGVDVKIGEIVLHFDHWYACLEYEILPFVELNHLVKFAGAETCSAKLMLKNVLRPYSFCVSLFLVKWGDF